MPRKPQSLTFIMAPDIPLSECKVLEQHWKAAVADPDYLIATNYSLEIKRVAYSKDEIVAVRAPALPVVELKILRERIEKAKNVQDAAIVVNYCVEIDVLRLPRPTVFIHK
jgi:hypothetical protein